MNSTRESQSILIVGASVAGLSTAEALRRRGHRGPLTVIDAESGPAYDRPPLSKQFLSGAWNDDAVMLRIGASLETDGVVFRRGERALDIDLDERLVHTTRGHYSAEHVVIATGVHPRTLAGGDVQGVYLLRSLDDATRLRRALRTPTGPVAVIGHGVLGSEIAATAAQIGREVQLIGSGRAPMSAQLGDTGSSVLSGLHDAAGVTMHNGRRASYIHENQGRADGVVLDDGTFVEASTVVVATGSIPSTAWLDGSGVDIADGVRCDSRGEVADRIWAVGDVARFGHLGLGRHVRLENRTNATDMAQAVAGNILGDDAPYLPVPYFWTDQYGVRIQVYGEITAGARIDIVEGSPEGGRFVAVASDSRGTVGVLGWGMPKQARIRSAELQARNESVLFAAGV